MKKTWGRLQGIGWVLYILGFLIPFPLVFITQGKEPVVFVLLGVFFGTATLLLIGSTILSAFSGHSKKLKHGPLVFGTIVSVNRTGMLVNHQPQVDITVQFSIIDGQPLTGSDRRVVPLTELAQIQPGAMVPLRYNPEKPAEIMIDTQTDQATLQEGYNQWRVRQGLATQESMDIAKQGVRAHGVILAMQPTGRIVQGHAEIRFEIKVTRPNGSMFEAECTKVWESQHVPKVQPGCVVDIYYMPYNEQKVTMGVSGA
jgi:hypothetical protein